MSAQLQRRLHRKGEEICCSEIRDFLEKLFRARLERHNITLTATKAFTNAKVVGFPSSFYPVFVNLVDNAIFRLSQQNPQLERSIRLDECDGTLLILDTGPGISVRDQEAIFEIDCSSRPGGRVMDLHSVRETLRRVRFDLKLIDGDDGDKDTTFAIVPMEASRE